MIKTITLLKGNGWIIHSKVEDNGSFKSTAEIRLYSKGVNK